MNRTATSLSLTLILGCSLLSSGCKDHKALITMLEESNQQLMEELDMCHDDLVLAQQSTGQQSFGQTSEDCRRELAAARRQVEDLSSQLVNRYQPPPQPQRQMQPIAQVPAGWQAVPGGAMIAVEGSVLFTSGKASLRKGAKGTLSDIAGVLDGQYHNKDILVFGHTDNTPIKKSGWKDNYQLSTERALAVVRHLKNRGISPKRLVACGCGEHRPRVPNSSSGNRQQNRRVEIFALDADVQTAGR